MNVDVYGNVRPLERSIRQAAANFNQMGGKSMRPLGQGLSAATVKADEFRKSLDASNARVLAFGASAGVIYGVVRAMKELVTATINVEKNMAEMNVLLRQSSSNLKDTQNKLFNIARATGQSFAEVSEAGKEFARQGLGTVEMLKRVNAAMTLTRLSGQSTADSIKTVTAALNTFSNEALKATEIVNKMANVDAAFAVSMEDLSSAISRGGAVAAAAGVKFDEFMGMVAAAQQTTARGGKVIGNAFKTIFIRMDRPKVLDYMKELNLKTHATGAEAGYAAGELLSLKDRLTILAKAYHGTAVGTEALTNAQKSKMTTMSAGLHQVNVFVAMLNDLAKAESLTGKAIEISSKSQNEAFERLAKLQKTLAHMVEGTKTSLIELANSLGELGVKDLLKDVFTVIQKMSQGLKKLTDDSSGMGNFIRKVFKGIGEFISGPGFTAAVLLIGKFMAQFAVQASQALGSMAGLTNATARRLHLEKQVVGILSQETALIAAVQKGEMTRQQAAQTVLATLRAQTVQMQLQGSLVGATMGVAARGVLGRGGYKQPKVSNFAATGAGGVPNFAMSASIGDVLSAARAEKSAGYTPMVGYTSKTGLMVYGREQGSAQAAIGEHLSSGQTLGQAKSASFMAQRGMGRKTVPHFAFEMGDVMSNPLLMMGGAMALGAGFNKLNEGVGSVTDELKAHQRELMRSNRLAAEASGITTKLNKGQLGRLAGMQGGMGNLPVAGGPTKALPVKGIYNSRTHVLHKNIENNQQKLAELQKTQVHHQSRITAQTQNIAAGQAALAGSGSQFTMTDLRSKTHGDKTRFDLRHGGATGRGGLETMISGQQSSKKGHEQALRTTEKKIEQLKQETAIDKQKIKGQSLKGQFEWLSQTGQAGPTGGYFEGDSKARQMAGVKKEKGWREFRPISKAEIDQANETLQAQKEGKKVDRQAVQAANNTVKEVRRQTALISSQMVLNDINAKVDQKLARAQAASSRLQYIETKKANSLMPWREPPGPSGKKGALNWTPGGALASMAGRSAGTAMFAAPIIGGIVAEGMDKKTKKGRTQAAAASGIGNAVGYAAMGYMMGGPLGAAVGGTVGALQALNSTLDTFGDTTYGLAEAASSAQELVESLSGALQTAAQNHEAYARALTGKGVKPEELRRRRERYVQTMGGAMGKVRDPSVRKALRDSQGDFQEMSAILRDYSETLKTEAVGKSRGLEFLQLGQKENKGFFGGGRRGNTVSQLMFEKPWQWMREKVHGRDDPTNILAPNTAVGNMTTAQRAEFERFKHPGTIHAPGAAGASEITDRSRSIFNTMDIGKFRSNMGAFGYQAFLQGNQSHWTEKFSVQQGNAPDRSNATTFRKDVMSQMGLDPVIMKYLNELSDQDLNAYAIAFREMLREQEHGVQIAEMYAKHMSVVTQATDQANVAIFRFTESMNKAYQNILSLQQRSSRIFGGRQDILTGRETNARDLKLRELQLAQQTASPFLNDRGRAIQGDDFARASAQAQYSQGMSGLLDKYRKGGMSGMGGKAKDVSSDLRNYFKNISVNNDALAEQNKESSKRTQQQMIQMNKLQTQLAAYFEGGGSPLEMGGFIEELILGNEDMKQALEPHLRDISDILQAHTDDFNVELIKLNDSLDKANSIADLELVYQLESIRIQKQIQQQGGLGEFRKDIYSGANRISEMMGGPQGISTYRGQDKGMMRGAQMTNMLDMYKNYFGEENIDPKILDQIATQRARQMAATATEYNAGAAAAGLPLLPSNKTTAEGNFAAAQTQVQAALSETVPEKLQHVVDRITELKDSIESEQDSVENKMESAHKNAIKEVLHNGSASIFEKTLLAIKDLHQTQANIEQAKNRKELTENRTVFLTKTHQLGLETNKMMGGLLAGTGGTGIFKDVSGRAKPYGGQLVQRAANKKAGIPSHLAITGAGFDESGAVQSAAEQAIHLRNQMQERLEKWVENTQWGPNSKYEGMKQEYDKEKQAIKNKYSKALTADLPFSAYGQSAASAKEKEKRELKQLEAEYLAKTKPAAPMTRKERRQRVGGVQADEVWAQGGDSYKYDQSKYVSTLMGNYIATLEGKSAPLEKGSKEKIEIEQEISEMRNLLKVLNESFAEGTGLESVRKETEAITDKFRETKDNLVAAGSAFTTSIEDLATEIEIVRSKISGDTDAVSESIINKAEVQWERFQKERFQKGRAAAEMNAIAAATSEGGKGPGLDPEMRGPIVEFENRTFLSRRLGLNDEEIDKSNLNTPQFRALMNNSIENMANIGISEEVAKTKLAREMKDHMLEAKEAGYTIQESFQFAAAAAARVLSREQFKAGRTSGAAYGAQVEADMQGKVNTGTFDISKDFGDLFTSQFARNFRDNMQEMKDLVVDLTSTMKTEMGSAFKSWMDGSMKARDALKGMFSSIMQTMLDASVKSGMDSLFAMTMGPSKDKGGIRLWNKGGLIPKYQKGGRVRGGSGTKDDVFAQMQGGEYVMRKSAAQRLGYDNLDKMNQGGMIRGFAGGGVASFTGEHRVAWNDPKKPSMMRLINDPRMSTIAKDKDSSNPQIQKYYEREAAFYDYKHYLYERAEEHRKAMEEFRRGQRNRVIGAAISGALTVGGAMASQAAQTAAGGASSVAGPDGTTQYLQTDGSYGPSAPVGWGSGGQSLTGAQAMKAGLGGLGGQAGGLASLGDPATKLGQPQGLLGKMFGTVTGRALTGATAGYLAGQLGGGTREERHTARGNMAIGGGLTGLMSGLSDITIPNMIRKRKQKEMQEKLRKMQEKRNTRLYHQLNRPTVSGGLKLSKANQGAMKLPRSGFGQAGKIDLGGRGKNRRGGQNLLYKPDWWEDLKLANGGSIGGTAADVHPAMLMGGEYVLNRDAVDNLGRQGYGVNFLNQLNQGGMSPAFGQAGGLVGEDLGKGSSSPAMGGIDLDELISVTEDVKKAVEYGNELREGSPNNTSSRKEQTPQNTGSGGTTNNISISVNVASNGDSNTRTDFSSSSTGSPSRGGEGEGLFNNMSQEDGKKFGQIIESSVLDIINREQRPFGLLSKEKYE